MKLSTFFIIAIIFLALFLRFYQIEKIPHGLYIDEISSGYNGYRILTTGKDEYGIPFPLFFKAFGEYKMPVLIYSIALSMAMWGKTELAVRIPSVVSGTLTVVLFYFLIKDLIFISIKLSKPSENKNNLINLQTTGLPLIATMLLAISPWHIQFSRGGFDATIALFLYILGIFLFIRYLKDRNFFILFGSFLVFVLTLYAYNTFRLIVPLTLLVVVIYLFRDFSRHSSLSNNTFFSNRHIRFLIIISFFSIVLMLPMFLFSQTSEGLARFQQTSAFSNYGNSLPLLKKLVIYPLVYFKNYLSYFSFPFLFFEGDGIGRHTVRDVGPLFRCEIIFLLIGVFRLVRERRFFISKVTFFLFIVAPVSAALSAPSPHLLRSLTLVIPLTLTMAVGISSVLVKKQKIIKVIILPFLILAVFEFFNYLHLYYQHYPQLTSPDWGAENKQIVLDIAKIQQNYSRLIINSNLGMIDSYLKFYDDSLKYLEVDDSWKKPQDWKSVLYVRAYDGKKPFPLKLLSPDCIKPIQKDISMQNKLSCPKLIHKVFLMNNRDIAAEFYEL